MRVLAGTSGFSYPEWRGTFYPQDLADDRMLRYYAERLPSVEINNTFYRMPRAELLERWKAEVPDSFCFGVKAPRRITHIARLKDSGEESSTCIACSVSSASASGRRCFNCLPS